VAKKGRLSWLIFLNIALGSANESEYYVILSKDLNYISEEAHSKLATPINEIKAMLIALTIKVCE
jgi:four helix bundle protein